MNPLAMEPEFVNEDSTARALSRLFSNDSLLDDRAQSAVIEMASNDQAEGKRAIIRAAMSQLGDQAPQHSSLLKTIITDILVLPSAVAKGGSTSQAIGVIWMNPKLTYSLNDVTEILVHELTHHAMFLDELRYSHYSYADLFDHATWTTSAILRVPRPLDKVLHSIIVATEVLLFRQHISGHPTSPRVHPPSPVMIEQLRTSIRSTESTVAKNDAALRPRAAELLRNAKLALEKLEQTVLSCT